jgi:hypothetical protein
LVNNPLQGDSNTLPWKRVVTRIKCVFCGSAPTSYNEDYRESLEMAVKDDGKKGIKL